MKPIWRSPTLLTVVIYGISGLGFAGANLILARLLPTEEYGLFTLVTALIYLGYALAPAGVDGIVNRRQLDPGLFLFRRSLAASLLVGGAFVIIAELVYDLGAAMSVLVFVSSVAGGLMAVAGAQFQSERRFGISLGLTQSPNLVLIFAAVAVVLSGHRGAWLPLIIAAVGFVLAAFCGWWILFRERGRYQGGARWFPWSEALSFAGLNAAGLLLIQLERLVIPHVLSVHELATYGVLAAIAGSLFRVLQMGVGYTLVPRLRATSSVPERRRLIAHEAGLVGALALAGAVVIWFVTPLVEEWLLEGKYQLSAALLLAAVVSGMIKIMNSFAKSIAVALTTPSELAMVNLLGWTSAALAVPAAAYCARWGLAGVIYGVGLGWLSSGLTAFYFALRHLKVTASVPVTST